MDLSFLKNKSVRRKIKPSGRLVIYLGLILMVWAILLIFDKQSRHVFNLWPEDQVKPETVSNVPDEFSGGPLIKLQGTYLRTGLIIDKRTDNLTMESPKLVGSGMDRLKIFVNSSTPVIEVRIPQVLDKEPIGDKRPETIERRVVNLDKVEVGQVVSVLSSEDIANKLEFTASRIEYSKIVNF